jgi:hypothetical protein
VFSYCAGWCDKLRGGDTIPINNVRPHKNLCSPCQGEESIHGEIVAKVVEETKKMTMDPLKRSTAHAPQNHLKHLQDPEAFCKKGR